MKLTKKLEAEIKVLMDDYWDSYFRGDLKHWAKYLVNDYRNIGGTEEEIWNSKKEILDYTFRVIDQMKGQAEIRNKKTQIIPYEPYIMVHEFMDLFIKVEGKWNFYGKFRLSSLIQKIGDEWKVLHQHGSYPDSHTEQGEAFAFDNLRKENTRLREAVQRRTVELENKNRELEIETALEKVRAVAMGMKQPDDMLDMCQVICAELQKLGVGEIRNIQTAIIDTEKDTYLNYEYFRLQKKKLVTAVEYKKQKDVHAFVKKMLKDPEGFFTTQFKGVSLKQWIQYQVKDGQFVDPATKRAASLHYYFYSIGPGALGISTYAPLTKDAIVLFKRFRNVFQLAYRRFIDIENAIAQAKEAQIEASLERVRAQAMAMHKSDELLNVCEVMYKELKSLGFEEIRNAMIHTFNEQNDFFLDYDFSGSAGGKISQIPTKGFSTVENYLKEIKKSNDTFLEFIITGEELKSWKKVRKATGQLEDIRIDSLDELYYYYYSIGMGDIGISAFTPISKEKMKILERFRNVFQLSYQRYHDIEKAEAQAREAQIEAALERVRSSSLAMHRSDELQGVVNTVIEQLKELNIELDTTNILIFNSEFKSIEFWTGSNSTGKQLTSSWQVSYTDYILLKEMHQAQQKGEAVFLRYLSFKEKNNFFDYIFTNTDFKNLNAERKKFIFESERASILGTFVKDIGIQIISYSRESFLSEEIEILKRFTKVFEQAYTRFLDLQKAEAQARESQIELGLERVRARAMAMQNSDELKELIGTVFTELTKLDLALTRCIIWVFEPATNAARWWMANSEEPSSPMSFYLKYHKHPAYLTFLQEWKKQNVKFVYDLNGADKVAWDDILFNETELKQLPDVVKNGMKAPERVLLSASFNNFGGINVASLESLSDEHFDLLLRFAKVFDLTYTRFNDLKKAEAQAREAQIELGLERVRARAMAMQKSEELSELVDTVFKELTKLDFALNWCIINIIDAPSLTNMVWAANPETNKPPESYLMKFEDFPFHHSMMKGYQERKTKHVYVLEGKEKKTYDDYLFNKTEWRRVPRAAQAASRAMKRYVATFTFSNFGGLQTVGEEYLSEENLDILSRFGKVFDLTYTRFNDLQKAETQAREAQIEAALERVRSRSMAMHLSNDLQEVVRVLSDQLLSLGLKFDTVSFAKVYEDASWDTWISTPDQPYPAQVHVPYSDHVIYSDINEADKRKEKFFQKNYTFEEKNSFFNYFFENTVAKNIPEARKQYVLNCKGFARSVFLLKDIWLSVANYEGIPFSIEENAMLQRFANVFEQAYTRFLDLQKAEAQAREAQIEAALERVRSRSLAMHSSGELGEVVTVVLNNLLDLGYIIDQGAAAHLAIFSEGTKDFFQWSADPALPHPVRSFIPHTDLPILTEFWDARQKGHDFFAKVYSFDEKNTWFNYAFEHSDLKHIPGELKKLLLESETYAHSVAIEKNSAIIINSITGNQLSENQIDILRRFSKVFEQAYIRFLDLQKAEAQAREAQIEVSLERVRARTMAMHNSDDVSTATATMFTELKKLGIENIRGGITIISPDQMQEVWSITNLDDGKTIRSIGIFDMRLHPFWRELFKAWNNKEQFQHYWLGGNDKEDYIKILNATPNYLSQRIEGIPDIHIQSYFFGEGAVWSNSIEPHSEEDKQIMKRFASVFSLTFRRYQDLQKAEAQAREAQIEAALEKVRSRSLAMHKSEELSKLVAVLFEKLNELGVTSDGININIVKEGTKDFESWLAAPGQSYAVSFHVPYFEHPVTDEIFEAFETQKELLAKVYSFEEKNSFFNYLYSNTNFKYLPEDRKRMVLDAKSWEVSIALAKNTALSLHSYSGKIFSESENDILKRFAKVFQQSHTRFLDLQKAEAQAREAQIETALEKVRSSSMAMHKSDELHQVINVVTEQFQQLGFQFDTANFITNYSKSGGDWWISTPGVAIPAKMYCPSADIVFFNNLQNVMQKQADFFTEFFSMEEKNELFDYIFEHTILKQIPEERKQYIYNSKGIASSSVVSKNVILSIANYQLVPYSEEENAILKRIGKVFEQSYTRFLDLQKAEAQVRESQIEAALERVRSKTMAMHNSQDVGETVATMFDQLVHLGVTTNRCGILIFSNTNNTEVWTAKSSPAGEAALIIGHLDVTIHPMLQGVRNAWTNKETFHSYDLAGDDIKKYYSAINNYPDYPTRFNLDNLPAKEIHSDFFFPEGAVFSFTAVPVAEEAALIFKRFAGVFGQTYRRYLDLLRAEAQARQAQIETAMEKVRARALAMQKPAELVEVAEVLRKEMGLLGVEELETSSIYIHDEASGNAECWYAIKKIQDDETKLVTDHMIMKLQDTWVGRQMLEFYHSDKKQISIPMQGENRKEWIHYCVKHSKAFEGFYGENIPDRTYHLNKFSNGYIGAASPGNISAESWDLLQRATSVFSLAYTRFSDLQQAEAQAREATIEAALEKVRGKAMAMHNSNDLTATASVVFTELRKLGINPIRCGVGLLNRESRKAQLYSATSLAGKDSLSLVGWVQLSDHPVLEEIYNSWQHNEDYFPQLTGEELKTYYEKLLSGFPIPVDQFASAQKQYGHFISVSVGCLYAWSEKDFNEEQLKIFKRFASIIDLTFRRYIELQKSEANARETVKQAALDRIRADIASMRTITDLERITPLIWNELTILGIPFIRCGVFIMDESQKLIHTFLSTPDGKAIGAFHLPYTTLGKIQLVLNNWREKRSYIDHWNEDAFIEFADILMKQGALTSPDQYLSTIPHGGFYLHFLPFLQGMLYVGNTVQLGEDEIKLIQSVADAFSTAYARYEDFNKLEAAKEQIENTLTNLKQAQAQLVQSEKMASLGELTAGIAHEIQNPLNFVNNFSEVSTELLDEMITELDKGDTDEAKLIADDVKQNLEKILHHGKRADGIVKGMLQHSRSSSATKEPADINKLADEYLRLAYHGLRAKDKSFNAAMITEYDESIGNINIIPQDIGRAVLNLITNAFYAVAEKKKQAGESYEPTVTVGSKKLNGKVEIKISDNGNGIPQKIVDKIFQPFFTTKPTGQGTGLGLSLSYDIVKAHGGELKVKTKEGEGAEFIIQLPHT